MSRGAILYILKLDVRVGGVKFRASYGAKKVNLKYKFTSGPGMLYFVPGNLLKSQHSTKIRKEIHTPKLNFVAWSVIVAK